MAGQGGKWREAAGSGGTAANAGFTGVAGDSRALLGSQKPDVLPGKQRLARMAAHHQEEGFVTPKHGFQSVANPSTMYIAI